MKNQSKTTRGVALVASPAMDDPRFAQTVVLLLHHNDQGAMGVVLNRPVGADQQATLAAAADLVGSHDLNFHFGGPVAGPVIVLQTGETHAGLKQGKMFFISKREQFSRLIRSIDDCRFFVGHANWEEGQLEAEIEQGLWKVMPVSTNLLFGEHDQMWHEAMREVGRCFYRDVLNIEGFPENPGLN